MLSPSLEYTPTPAPIIKMSAGVLTKTLASVKPTNVITVGVITTSIQVSSPVSEEYQQMLNAVLPRIVIAEVKNFTQTHTITDAEQSEQITIVNYGNEVDISGWYISDNQGDTYHFDKFPLSRASVVHLHTGKGINTEFDLYWNQDKPLWNSEDPHLTLFDNLGSVIDKW